MLPCPRCGSALEPGQSFCENCGSPVRQPAPRSAAPPSPAPPAPPPPPHAVPPSPAPASPLPPVPPATPVPAGIALSPKIVIAIVALLVIIAAVVFFVLPPGSPASGSSGGAGSPAGSGPSVPGPAATASVPASPGAQAAPDPDETQGPAGCPAGMTGCRGVCRDLLIDENNCGMCNFACPQGQTCRSGQCLLTCPSGFSDCEGSCRDPDTDESNCGACWNECPSDQVCRNGQCSEAAPYLPGTAAITTGSATQGCGGGQTLCSGLCANLLTDNGNCGSCAHRCLASQRCEGGQCVLSYCEKPYTLCSGACKNLNNDITNCGSCGNACPANPPHTTGSLCSAGRCTYMSCQPDYHDCNQNLQDGCEANVKQDEQDCGSCGVVCQYPKSCINGHCLIPK